VILGPCSITKIKESKGAQSVFSGDVVETARENLVIVRDFPKLRSDLYRRIVQGFKKEKIELPLSQLDIHWKSEAPAPAAWLPSYSPSGHSSVMPDGSPFATRQGS
jgi:hypothetical protein